MTAPKVCYTFNRLAEKLPMPASTLARRLRSHGIIPDAITCENGRPPVLLFEIERLPEIRRKLNEQGS